MEAQDAHPLFGMPLSGPAGSSFAGCERFPLLAVDGTSVAYSCSGDRQVTIRDLASGQVSTLPVGSTILDLDLAGAFIAIERSIGAIEIAVFNRTTGAQVYTAGTGDMRSVFSVQADGKLAVASPEDDTRVCDGTLAWHSPAHPLRHVVATGVCGTQVEITDLAGASRVVALFPVRRGLVSRPSLLGFDFEGGQVAYAEAGCGPDSVYLESAAAPSPVAPGATGCPARILTRRTRLPPGRILPVRFRCPRGRSMTYTLRVLRGNRAYIDPDIPLTVERGTRTVRIKLPRSVLRFLRGLRVARIELDAEVRSDRVSFRHRNVEAALRVRLR